MSISWEQFVDAFRVGSNTGNTEQLASLITEDFNWVTSGMDRRSHAVLDVRHFLQD